MFRFFESLNPRPDTIEEAMNLAAEEFVRVVPKSSWPEFADRLDHTEASLAAVDEWLDQFYTSRRLIDANRQFLCAAYIFEIARAQFGGTYQSAGKENPYVFVTGEPDSRVGFCAIEKVKMRTLNGLEDNIPFFYEGIAPALARKIKTTII